MAPTQALLTPQPWRMQSKTGSMQILFIPWHGDPPSDAPLELDELGKPMSGKLNGLPLSTMGGTEVSFEASSPVGELPELPPSSPGTHALHPPLLVEPLDDPDAPLPPLPLPEPLEPPAP
jgi:hypothetical protein